MHKFTNKLINETSPYLLQHAHNPVNWYPWGQEALEKSRIEDKPMLVSIGYSACHWCHVMEKESFENEATAQIMNEHFINIKIDREERPDLDHLYMDAVQAMTGSGGWPLNVFLTPDRKPFYGGTYFPPVKAFNRSSWQEILLGLSQAFRERRNEIESQAENLTAHIAQSNFFGIKAKEETDFFSIEKIEEVFQNIMKSADKDWGGFSRAPKFPQTFIIQFLLRYHHITGNNDALRQALLSIDKMIDGGIYDQVGGGLARYSTDTEWLVPHFEKMLYDNALLVSVLCEAYQLTGNKRYEEVIDETIRFIQSEMMNVEGGFYSALDADSEGEEGKFYVWDYQDVKNILGDDADIFCEFFDISLKGNWLEKPDSEIRTNILRRKKEIEPFVTNKNISVDQLTSIIKKGKGILFEKRKKRIRPQTDDKSLLGWNALMNTALTKAFAATGNEIYKGLAISNMEFLLDQYSTGVGIEFHHSWKNGLAKQPAFLDDYAYLVQALIHLQEVTTETKYLEKAKEITSYVIEHFSDPESPFFFFSSDNQEDILIRKIDLYDGAQPSGNAIMAGNLYRLGLYFDIPAWREKSLKAVNTMGQIITRYPISFGVWSSLLQEMTDGVSEIAIVDKNYRYMLSGVLREYIPHKIIMATTEGNNHFPLLNGKKGGAEGSIYLCRNYTCKNPVKSVEELLSFISRK